MIPSNDISKAITMAKKVSDQMAAFDKISSSLKTAMSLSEKYVSIAKLSKTFVSTPKFYDCGSYAILCDISKYQDFVVKIPEGNKFYGGGSWEPISSNVFQLPLTNNKYKEIDIDIVLSKDNKGNWFNTLDLIKSSGLIARLDSIDAIRKVTEQNLKDKLKFRDGIVDNISNILNSLEGSYKCQTKIDINSDRHYFEECDSIFNLYDSLEKFLSCEETLNFELSKIAILDRLYKSIKGTVKKITLNKREIFRKINSFHFKNLDDYHSISVAA